MLYKYRSLSNYKILIDILANNRLYAANFKQLNDPMEGVYFFYNDELKEEFRKNINEGKNGLGICSLSKGNDVELLWAHYANGERGICIGLSIVENGTNYTIRNINYDESKHPSNYVL